MLQRSRSLSPDCASALPPGHLDQLKRLTLEDDSREWTPDSQGSGVDDGDRTPPSVPLKSRYPPDRASALLPGHLDLLKRLALEDDGREWTPDSQVSGVEDGDRTPHSVPLKSRVEDGCRMPVSEALNSEIEDGYQTPPSQDLKSGLEDGCRTPPSDTQGSIVYDACEDEDWNLSHALGSGVDDIFQDADRMPLSDSHSRWSADDEAKFIDLFLDYTMDAFKSADALISSNCSYDMDFVYERQSKEYADFALQHYNDDPRNEIKYELIKAIASCTIMDCDGSYGHVNFTAKAKTHGSHEELFFAELHNASGTCTCVVSLEHTEKIGGRPYFEGDYSMLMDELPIDSQNCYACGNELKHPEHGSLYKAGHVVLGDYYDYA